MDEGMLLLEILTRMALAMVLVGWIPALIARTKGRNFMTWWIYGGAFFAIALVHSLLIKPETGLTGATYRICEPPGRS